MTRKMVFLMQLADQHLNAAIEAAPGWEVIHSKESSDWLPHLKDAEIVVGWNNQAAQQCLTGESALRWVHTWGAGVDRFPFDAFKRGGVMLTNSSGVHSYPISETIIGIMLAFTRKLDVYVRNQLEKKWHHSYIGLEMHEKTIGLMGVGAIGKETARIAKAFRMRVLGFTRSGIRADYVDRMCGLHELLSESDYVVNTLPGTEATFHLIGKSEFETMKPTAYYINIGRGQTTDTIALIDALRTKRIAGAGLDVFEEEPLPRDHPLWEMDNVIIAPHSSGSTEQYNDRVMDIFLPNLREYVQGKEPTLNRVDLDLQY